MPKPADEGELREAAAVADQRGLRLATRPEIGVREDATEPKAERTRIRRGRLDAAVQAQGAGARLDIIAAIDRFDSDDMVTLVAVHGTTDGAPAIGSQTPAPATGNAARVRATGQPSRIDRYTEQIISASGFRCWTPCAAPRPASPCSTK